MKINRRLKILREKLGYSQEAFTQILFEDADPHEQKKYKKLYPLIESGKEEVSILLIQQILIKFHPNPYWLIKGEKQMDSEINDRLVIKLNGQDGNRQNIHIVDDKELVTKLLAEKDAHLERAYTEIKRLKETITLITDLKANQSSEPEAKPTSKPKSNDYQVAVACLFLLIVGMSLWMQKGQFETSPPSIQSDLSPAFSSATRSA